MSNIKDNKVYLVMAYRWGDIREHNYTVGVCSSAKIARRIAKDEDEARGGKYECKIKVMELNKGKNDDKRNS